MSNSKAARTKKFNPVQMVLMPVLGLVLVTVLFWPKAKVVETVVVATIPDGLGDIPVVATPIEKSLPTWPVAKLKDVLAFDPFQPIHSQSTALLVVPKNTQIENTAHDESVVVSTPNNLGTLQAIYFDTRGGAAILDSRVVRVGDVLANGSKVVEITAKSIAVE